MASALHTLSRAMQRRLLLAYVAREMGWRVMLVLVAAIAARLFAPAWVLPWAVLVAAAIDWIVRWRPPGQLISAIEIDRQLALKELISTGLLAHERDGLAAAARQQAEDAAKTIDPRQLQVGKHGQRYWIAALLLVGVLAAMPEVTGIQRWAEVAGDPSNRSGDAGDEALTEPSFAMPALHSRPGTIGSATSDFASSVGAEEEVTGDSNSGERPSRSQGDVRGSGGGLATGGEVVEPPAGPSEPVGASRENSKGNAGAGAGRVDREGGGSAGTGTIAAGPSQSSPTRDDHALAEPGNAPAPDVRAFPHAYRDIIKAYYAR